MSEPLSTDPYKGVRDFYPADWARMMRIFARIRKVLSMWGYEEYNASPLERAEIYEEKSSEEIVNEQTYTFVDRGDRRVTLRPEMTPTLARMIAGKRRELTFPLRWFSIGNRFRYERPQRGRLREFYQADVDFIGLPEGDADVEIVRLASEILKAFGAGEKDFVIRMNSRSLLNSACKVIGLKMEQTQRYLRFLDRKAKMTQEEFVAASGVFGDRDPVSIIDNPKNSQEVAEEKKKILDRIDLLKSLGVGNVVFDPHITRGFDYYTGMIFEVFDTNTANPRSVFGGGRYDGLVSLFGGEAIPAVGFALGNVTLSDFLETHSISLGEDSGAPQLYIGTPSVDDVRSAQAFASILRKDNIRMFVNLTDKALGDQIKDAVRRDIPFFVAYGANEIENKVLRLKTLATSKESTLSVHDLVARLRGAN
jgi:histidyl-tRNA synthetase